MKQGEQPLAEWVAPATSEDEIETREVYACAGVALYLGQVLEHALSNCLVLLNLTQRLKAKRKFHGYVEFEKYIDGLEGQNFKRTLGKLIEALKSSGVDIGNTVSDVLEKSLGARNDLAHHFFRRHAGDFFNAEGRNRMADELKEMRSLFEKADQELDAIVKPLQLSLGLKDADVEEFEKMITGGMSESDIKAYIRKKHLR